MPNRHGEFIWYELLTDDSDGALQFYSRILGWQATDSGQPGMHYRILHARDEDTGDRRDIGGLMQLTEEMSQSGARPVWLGYIGVDDVDQTVAYILTAGGTVQMPPTDIPDEIPGGDFILRGLDPQGALFALVGSRKA